MGISTVPPLERPLKSLSASSRLSALMAIFERFSFSFTGPKLSGTSLAIKTLLPMGNVICMILFASFSGILKFGT